MLTPVDCVGLSVMPSLGFVVVAIAALPIVTSTAEVDMSISKSRRFIVYTC